MNVLVLGKTPSPISPVIERSGCRAIESLDPVNVDFLNNNQINFIVSFGYRHMIRKPVLDHLPEKVINLHISYLPWNRGADPNLWSFLEATPGGVSIHYVDEGIDTGDIIAREKVAFDLDKETLATSYQKLEKAIINLFEGAWPKILNNRVEGAQQEGEGSLHMSRDKKRFEHLFTEEWDTEVSNIYGKALNE